ncbi:MAG TPA: hypothetical protein VFO34_15655, partial [Candidatus Acidoferrales bacterium]|nr:hypothetical protein [Candidatus Acidoferrales bacterium]
GWIAYGNSDGNFTALMPIQPKITPNAANQGQVSNTIQALADDGVAYTVVYVRNAEAQPVDEQTFQLYRDMFLKSVPTCSVLAEFAASPDVQGLVGHAYRLNCVINNVNMTMTGDLYWGRHYAYAVFAMFGPMVSDPAEARKFVDSFKVIDPSK